MCLDRLLRSHHRHPLLAVPMAAEVITLRAERKRAPAHRVDRQKREVSDEIFEGEVPVYPGRIAHPSGLGARQAVDWGFIMVG